LSTGIFLGNQYRGKVTNATPGPISTNLTLAYILCLQTGTSKKPITILLLQYIMQLIQATGTFPTGLMLPA
jgi:hypothetical protein